MLNLAQMQEIAKTQNVIFGKDNCRFCTSSVALMDILVEQKILDSYFYYELNVDFDNETLLQLVLKNGWQPEDIQSVATKPQIFIQGNYIGGNFDFYKSNWNVGENMPNIKNLLRF
jgi:glutaredoxin